MYFSFFQVEGLKDVELYLHFPIHLHSLMLDWFIDDVDGVRSCLWTAVTNGPILHPPGDIWVWENDGEVMMPAEENSWLVHQSCLAILPAESSWSK
jgi:hypothetical protein